MSHRGGDPAEAAAHRQEGGRWRGGGGGRGRERDPQREGQPQPPGERLKGGVAPGGAAAISDVGLTWVGT